MIGDFIYGEPDGRAVAVQLMWQGDRRSALVQMPEDVREAIDLAGLGADQGVIGVELALAYAVFVSMSSGSQLMVSGDKTVWNNAWGTISCVQ